ncbi:MAG: SBBP repeat-containing protein [Ignavibacteria bacterium]|nr:SBBP repeat-containing protein [Ignavibacteria bacterium]
MKKTKAFFWVTYVVTLFVIFLIGTAYTQLSSENTLRAPFVSSINSQQSPQSIVQNSEKDIVFIENLGQIRDSKGNKRPDILFLTRSQGVDMYITSSGITYVFRKTEGDIKDRDNVKDVKTSLYRLDMEFIGVNKNIKVKKELAVEQQFNYYTPEYPDGISSKAYKKITIENIYDGIDLVYYEKEGKMKYDFVVKAGANPNHIKMKYRGAGSLYLNKYGSVIVTTPMGEIREGKPYTYLRSTGVEIESKYKVNNNIVQFNVAEYNKSENIIIDPYIGATYYGGSGSGMYGNDYGRSITTDGNNNIFITGETGSYNFPLQNPGGGAYFQSSGSGIYTVFIIKFNSNGIRQWATYFGGGGLNTRGNSITTDGNNNILITGTTMGGLPLQNPGGGAYFQGTFGGGSVDAFISKFNSSGVLQWATYYGGNSNDMGYSITTDGNNNILVTGRAGSTNFPVQDPGGGAYFQGTLAGNYDAFILKFNSNCVRQLATYYGGNYGDLGNSITTDGNNNILVTGETPSTIFPVQNPGGGAYYQGTKAGEMDAFILKFNPNCVRQWATYYGGSVWDYGLSITTYWNNYILITGYTYSTDFPLQNPGGGTYYQGIKGGNFDAFILKFNSNCVRQWSTFYGGGVRDDGHTITSDENNNILVTGRTQSTDFPLQNPGGGAYYQGSNSGNYDAFILKFNSIGVRQWATYYGGSDRDIGHSITTDGSNYILVTGETISTNFPVYNPGGGAYFQGTNVGKTDVFILSFNPSGVITGIKNLTTSIPLDYELYQNYPNPFNPTTNIKFDISKSSFVKMIIYNSLGKEISTIVNKKLSAGSYEVDWDGSGYPSGVYFYKLTTDGFVDEKKMVLVK